MTSLAVLLSITSQIYVPKAVAWDIDTHFYSTYSMARYVGFNHQVSMCFALGNQWIDESAWTSPMFPLLGIGSRLRRLYHFAGNRMKAKSETHGILKFKTITMARPNDPVGTELILEAARKGDCLGIGAGLHTRDDTTGHQGFPAELGHAQAGHWPDRTWVDSAGGDGWQRYSEMAKNKISALCAIREIFLQQRPDQIEKFLDPKFSDPAFNKPPHYTLSKEDLTEMYLSKPEVRQITQNNIFTDPRYTRMAVNHLLDVAIENGYIKSQATSSQLKLTANGVLVDQLQLPESAFVPGKDVRALAKEQILYLLKKEKELGRSILDRRKIYSQLLYSEPIQAPHNNFDPKLLTPEQYGIEKIAGKIAESLCTGLIPRPLSADWLFEVEAEGPLRKLEMELRTGDWIKFNKKMYGKEGAARFERRGLFEQLRRGVVTFHNFFHGKKSQNPVADTEEYLVSTPASDQVRWWKLHFIYAWLDGLPGVAKKRYRESWKDYLVGNPRYRADAYNNLIDYTEKFKAIIDEEFKRKILTPEERDITMGLLSQFLEFTHQATCILGFEKKDPEGPEGWYSKNFNDPIPDDLTRRKNR